MHIKLEIDGQKQFDYAIDVIKEGVSDWRPVWPEIEQVYYRVQLEQFNTEGVRGGQKWAPLSAKYAKWKEKKAPGQPILVLSGRLRRSMTVIGAGGQDAVNEQTPESITLGTVVPYAGYHQRGTRKMPARQPMQFQRNDFGKMVSRMFRYAERIGKTAGFKTESRARQTPTID